MICIKFVKNTPKILNNDHVVIIFDKKQRNQTKNSKSCILLTNKNSKDAIGMDHKNILIGLALKKYALDSIGNPNMRLCI